MSRHEELRTELGELRRRQAVAVGTPALAAGLLFLLLAASGPAMLLAALACFALLPLVLHPLWRLAFPAYRAWSDRASSIRTEMAGLRRRMEDVFGKYRARRKGEQFKQAYDLAGRSVRDLEEALSVGMFRERREVFVTAFVRRGVALRVTASIGSPFRCSAGDNPAHWRAHAERLDCDELRQYHNHPVHDGVTRPSATDVRSSGQLRRLLGPSAPKLRSLIICWNDLREWKVFEYDEAGRHSLHFEFDAASS